MTSKYMGEKWERKREAEWFVRCGKGQKRRNKDGGTWTDAGDLLATWGHGESNWRRLTVEVCLLPGAMMMSGLGCCPGPCLSSWPQNSQGLN